MRWCTKKFLQNLCTICTFLWCALTLQQVWQWQHISTYLLLGCSEDESEPATWDYWGQNFHAIYFISGVVRAFLQRTSLITPLIIWQHNFSLSQGEKNEYVLCMLRVQIVYIIYMFDYISNICYRVSKHFFLNYRITMMI